VSIFSVIQQAQLMRSRHLYMFRVLTPVIMSTVVRAPDYGCQHPKHVQSCLHICNKLNTVASCWAIIQLNYQYSLRTVITQKSAVISDKCFAQMAVAKSCTLAGPIPIPSSPHSLNIFYVFSYQNWTVVVYGFLVSYCEVSASQILALEIG